MAPKREVHLRLSFPATNNKVEYKALHAGLYAIKKLGGKAVDQRI